MRKPEPKPRFGDSSAGRAPGPGGVLGFLALPFASMLTTAGSTFLTTSRYEVNSLGTAGAGAALPCRNVPVANEPRAAPSNSATAASGQRFMAGDLWWKKESLHS